MMLNFTGPTMFSLKVNKFIDVLGDKKNLALLFVNPCGTLASASFSHEPVKLKF